MGVVRLDRRLDVGASEKRGWPPVLVVGRDYRGPGFAGTFDASLIHDGGATSLSP